MSILRFKIKFFVFYLHIQQVRSYFNLYFHMSIKQYCFFLSLCMFDWFYLYLAFPSIISQCLLLDLLDLCDLYLDWEYLKFVRLWSFFGSCFVCPNPFIHFQILILCFQALVDNFAQIWNLNSFHWPTSFSS
jgi:hypothetical protein